MTDLSSTKPSPFAMPLALCAPLWPAYGLFMGATLQWWALSRMARFASPTWAFETRPKSEAPPVTPAAEPAAAAREVVEVSFDPAPGALLAPPAELEDAAPAPPADVAAESIAEAVAFVEPSAAMEAEEVEPTTPEPEPAVAAASLTAADVDELTLIRGIGPRVADALVARGVMTFAQLAAWTEKDMHHFDVEMKLLGRSKRYDFLGQAKALASQA